MNTQEQNHILALQELVGKVDSIRRKHIMAMQAELAPVIAQLSLIPKELVAKWYPIYMAQLEKELKERMDTNAAKS